MLKVRACQTRIFRWQRPDCTQKEILYYIMFEVKQLNVRTDRLSEHAEAKKKKNETAGTGTEIRISHRVACHAQPAALLSFSYKLPIQADRFHR